MDILNQVRTHGDELSRLLKAGAEPEEITLAGDQYIAAQMAVVKAIKRLPDELEQNALIGFYCCGASVDELAEMLHLTAEQAQRILKAAAEKLAAGSRILKIARVDTALNEITEGKHFDGKAKRR